MWNIVADENMPLIEELFAEIGQKTSVIKRLAGRSMSREDVKDADALLIRSITQVDKALLEGSNVRFVGSATIGTDHVDMDYLAQQNIQFASAPGCNAQGVAEYVLTSIAYWAEKRSIDLSSVTVGIIGAGNVGTRVSGVLESLGIDYVLNDPPLQAKGDSRDFVDLNVIQQCDVVTCHVPMAITGQFPTHHLINSSFLKTMPEGALLINTARGAVVDNQAALKVKSTGKLIDYILDVWEGEPDVSIELMKQVMIATPHIAGYSQEGKIRGTYQLYQAFNQWQNREGELELQRFLPNSPKWTQPINLDGLYQVIKPFYDIEEDDHRMRQVESSISQEFDRLRKNYPQRLEFMETN